MTTIGLSEARFNRVRMQFLDSVGDWYTGLGAES